MKQGSNARDWCRLIRDRRWSARQKRQLIGRFVRPERVFSASLSEHRDCVSGRINANGYQAIDRELEQDLQWLQHPNHHLITWADDTYPDALRQIHDAPIALFAIGDVSLLHDPCVALVGARRPTPVGTHTVEKFVGQLASMGLVIVSGLALGIDGCAHRSALSIDGKTIAVLGSGFDHVTPVRHQPLFDQIASCGLVLSEYPLGFPATRYTFPERNRIVSGLSLGVVIVEAAKRSGTLITARLATEQSREVMVVPGSVLSAQYQGSHRLIQQGAALVTSANDVLACLSTELTHTLAGMSPTVADRVGSIDQQLTPDCRALLSHIGAEPTGVDDIIMASGLTAAEVSSMLITLEIKGAVAIGADGGYVNLS